MDNVLNIFGIIFMIVSMLIMMDSKVALVVTITLWIALTFASLIIRIRAKRIKK